jgi:hypothetical protein
VTVVSVIGDELFARENMDLVKSARTRALQLSAGADVPQPVGHGTLALISLKSRQFSSVTSVGTAVALKAAQRRLALGA